MNGVIPLFKPKGMTSHDCVAKIRHMIGIKKVGHTGTLDPDVEGVLPICVGEATKIIPFLSSLKKVYEATVSLGVSTTTEDATGEIVESKEITMLPAKAEIEAVLTSFTGEITQVPPMYSAIKVKGKKLYEYARENLTIERPKRQVMIHKLERIDTENHDFSNHTFSILVHCSKGTYIRTLCVDIGKTLGFPAHMASLQRTKTDSVHIKDTISFLEVEKAVREKQLDELMIPIEHMLKHIPTWQVNKQIKVKVLHGQKLSLPEGFSDKYIKVMHENQLLAIYEKVSDDNFLIKPTRVFNLHKGKVN